MFVVTSKTKEPEAAAIEAELARVNGRATAHTIRAFADVADVAERAEALLDAAHLPQRERAGAEVIYRPAGPSARSYGYRATTTTIRLRRVADGWRFVGAHRSEVHPKQAERFDVVITPRQREAIVKAALRPFTVAE